MVLLIPDDLTLPGWRYAFSIKEFLTAIVIGCIYFTLLVKALSIEKIIHKLGIDKLTEFEEVGYFKSKALIFDEVINTLNHLLEDKKISPRLYNELVKVYQKKHDVVMREYHDKIGDDRKQAERLLRVYVLGTEKARLKEIYWRGEINEKIYKKILNLLDIQMQRVEKGRPQLESINERFPVDMIEAFINFIRKVLFLPSPRLSTQELYVYYRAQYKLLKGAIKNLENLHNTSLGEIFDDPQALEKTIHLYQKIADNTKKNLELMIEENYEVVVAYNAEQGAKAIALKERDTLRYLSKNEIITPKLNIMLQKELLEKDTTLDNMTKSIKAGDS
jgi:CPA1 family monovalent cation:H+ antiporter